MGRRFTEFMREVERETRKEGAGAVAEAEAFRTHFQLAREFIERRQALGLTQRQLAERSGVQQSEISRIEGGNANPTFQTVQALARSLGAEVHLVRRRTKRRASLSVDRRTAGATRRSARYPRRREAARLQRR
jgi:transcriptional regulator with XRE-family HTH domain